nr:LptF/LptG family permease [Gemmatimonadaceae bacterium]
AEAARQDSLRRDSILRVEDSARIARGEAPVRDPNLPPPAVFAVTPEALNEALVSMSSYAVEVQKKFALSLACFVFVLFGPPIALRFPRGGVGVTIGVSLVVFGAYYVCLMAGEVLGDKGKIDPVIAMWAANVLFTLAGIVLLLRIERTADSSRGGGIREWFADRRARRTLRRTPSLAPPTREAGA